MKLAIFTDGSRAGNDRTTDLNRDLAASDSQMYSGLRNRRDMRATGEPPLQTCLERAHCSRIGFTEWPHDNQTLTKFPG